MYLSELVSPVGKLRGVGPALCRDLGRLGIRTVAELLMHLPREYDDRSVRRPLGTALVSESGGEVNTTAFIEGHEYFGPPPNKTLKILIRDETAAAELVCFGRNFLARSLPQGMRVNVAGRFEHRFGRLQCSAFDVEDADKNSERFSSILPIYPLAGRLWQPQLRKIIQQAQTLFGVHLQDELPPAVLSELNITPIAAALDAVHLPATMEESREGRKSLAFRELLVFQVQVVRRAMERRAAVRKARIYPRGIREQLITSLPFSLTPDQERTLSEISADVEADHPMARLLQGDVGSGKTLVAFAASTLFTAAGRQSAFMAPTELLARQHADNAARILGPLGVRLAFYSGSVSTKAKRPLLDALASGEIDLIIGTHALFSNDVVFKDLGFVVIDEQHRFGVSQRGRLTAKGLHPDVLVMSATPIPRTLALSAFGDMDVSELKTMPPGRKSIETHLAQEGKEEKVYDWVGRELAKGGQAYFVYPLVEGNESRDLKDAESMYDRLRTEIFPGQKIGLIHARLPEEEKKAVMERFTKGEVRVLAATSVVEVGVDVPNATCMVIEHAERFGLAALHQLRGRVGRGTSQSYAFLVYSRDLTEIGKQRLRVMKETTDGFLIAEEDLKLRGPGDMTGLRQAGLLDFRTARLPEDSELMIAGRKEAYKILESDPALLLPAHAGLRLCIDIEEGGTRA